MECQANVGQIEGGELQRAANERNSSQSSMPTFLFNASKQSQDVGRCKLQLQVMLLDQEGS